MKNFLVLLLFSLYTIVPVQAQIHDPVQWTTSVKKVSENTYDLVATATIEQSWHLYSQKVPENGPLPTVLIFSPDKVYELVGATKEEKGVTLFDPVFELVITYFENNTSFTQRIKMKNPAAALLTAEVEFMVCDESKCMPGYADLVFKIPAGIASSKEEPVMETEAEISLISQTTTITDSSLVSKDSVSTDKEIVKSTSHSEKKTKQRGLLTIFIIAFLSGFAALLTPCVFPMIPMTVSFFTKQSKTRAKGIRNAIIYGIAIIFIYIFLGIIVTLIFGAGAVNAIATNVWFNVIFFLILVIFALSFLGAFELVLPSSWLTKVDKEADRGGTIGIFFMALALALVSFSCTGPIVGYLLVEAASIGGIAPFVGMFGFALALALPFAFFAAFPGWLNTLPKSGGWLNTVKVFLGFLELALAFKFLSNADLVLQLHWLKREVFLAIWIAIFGVMAFYLFGKIKLPHDSDLPHISVGRLSLGLVTLAFTIYLIPGLWGAPLKLISGFPPPMQYSEAPYGVGYTKVENLGGLADTAEFPEGAHLGPQDILSFDDYETGLAYAKKVGKPVMIDFTGHACVNCRKMEERVWSEPKVLKILKDEVVLISLYVDDKRKLPKEEEIISKINGKKLKYIGQKWSEFQTLKYKANAQPFYVLMDLNEENLIDPVGYTPDVEEYYNWLQKGIAAFGE